MRRLITAAGAVAAVAGCVTGLLFLGPDTSRPSATASPAGAADRDTGSVETIRRRAAAYPDDPAAWADLAHTEIERARTTFDAGLLDAADKALHRSLALDGTDNYRAVTGRGLLANARHDFGEGRVRGLRATRMAPDRPDGYAVLADAEIQLGNYPQAREAVQRMLDIAPATAAYSRAAYDLETGGRPEDAAVALQRAVDSAVTQDERAFAEARLGDLAWSQGRTDRAARHYGRALSAVPAHPYGQAGLARVAAARGHTGKALELYARLVERMPLPQFLLESLDLRRASGDSHRGSERAVLSAQVRMARADGGPVDPHLILYAADHGDPEVAVELARREWKHVRSVIVADALAWSLHRAGRDTEALAYARRAAATGWKNALFRYHRGTIEQSLGMPEGPRRLSEAQALNPHFSLYRPDADG
ncbi:tetratricopeptide repeat protein [Streptomyces anulatus]|uniref:tetratricopeptide repeat protein n=1 Tax=Streptomyces anulatus TaxID=1892 RepID=UPI00224CFD21|nr:tetratricopeptide repeat protein [Streptomyces anulatus]MCX4487073.1 tetratricopeptide repeat protein [Streptomyces anulatus]